MKVITVRSIVKDVYESITRNELKTNQPMNSMVKFYSKSYFYTEFIVWNIEGLLLMQIFYVYT